MDDAGEDAEALLTTDHPQSMRTLAWTRAYRSARVFCFASGHDNQTWANPSFREALARGMRWAARRI
jgi:type 1 glutamine amidotransferase